MAYGPAELSIKANEAPDRAYGDAGVLAAEQQRAASEQTEDPLQQKRRGERSRAKAPTGPPNPGFMQTPPQAGADVQQPTPGASPTPVGPTPVGPTARAPVAPMEGDIAPAPAGITPRYAQRAPAPESGASHYLGDVGAYLRGGAQEIAYGLADIEGGDVGPGLLRAGGSLLGMLATPYVYVSGEVAQTGIEANPVMRDRFHQLLREQGIDPADQTQPNKRNEVANKVIEEFENAAYAAAYDPRLSPQERVDAMNMSSLLKAEQFAILGGPQAIRSISKIARALIARRAVPTINVPRDVEQKGAETGTITPKAAEAVASQQEIAVNKVRDAYRMALDSADENKMNDVRQRALAAGFKEEEVAKATADAERLHAVGVQDDIATAVGEVDAGASLVSPLPQRPLGPVLARAITAQNKNIQDLVRRGGTRGLTLDQMDEVIAALESAATKSGRDVPAAVMEPLRKMRELLYDETTLEQIRRATAEAELGAARVSAKVARAEAAATQAKARATGRAAEQGARKVGEQVAEAPDARTVALNKQMADISEERLRVQHTVEANRQTVRITGDKQAPEIGYMAPDDAAVWEQARLHTGKQDSPFTRRAMVDFVREHADEIDGALRHITRDDLITRLAQATNADRASLAKSLPKTAEVSRRLYVADQVLGNMVREWRQLGLDVRDGRATAEALDTKTAEVAEFMRAVTEGHSEVGRALGSLRIVRRIEAAEVVRGTEGVRRTERTLIRAQNQLEELAVEFERAAAGEAVTPEAQAALARIQARVQTAVERAAAARAEHEAAVQVAADASERLHRSLLEKAVKLNVSREKLSALAVLDPEDIQGVIHYFRDLAPRPIGEWLNGFLLNNTYGGIPSLANNWINTGLHVLYQNMLIRPIEEVATRHVARAIVGEHVVVPGETKAAWLAMYTAIPDAARLAMKVQLEGEAPELALKYGLEHLVVETAEKIGAGRRPLIQGKAGLLVEPILRNLTGSDGFWRVLDGAAESRASILRDVYVAQKGGDEAAVRELSKFLTNPSPEHLAVSNEHSLRATFNDPIKVGSPTGRLLNLLNVETGKGFAPLRILIPAARFGIAAAKRGASLSGGGLLTGSRAMGRARGLRAAGEPFAAEARRGAQEFTEGALGAMMLIVGWQMYEGGLVTGSYPTKSQEQERWNLERRQASSVKIAGAWVPLSFLGPLGAPFLLVGMLRDQLAETDDATLADRIERGSMAIGRYMTDIPAFAGTYRLMDIVYSGVKYGSSVAAEKFASLQLSKIIPDSAFLRSLTPVWDPYERDPEGLIERLMARFPITSVRVRPAINPSGQPRERALSGAGALSPTQGVAPADLAGADAEIAQDGNVLMPVGNTIGGQTLSREEFGTYQQAAGQRSKAELEKLIATLRYKREGDPAVRQHLRDQVIDKARTEARQVVSKEFLRDAKGDEAVARAAIMVRSSAPADYVAALRTLQAEARLTQGVKDRLDATRGFNADGSRKPTVDDTLRGTIRR